MMRQFTVNANFTLNPGNIYDITGLTKSRSQATLIDRYTACNPNFEAKMAHIGNGYFDKRGHFFKTPEEATISDIAAILGRIGDGESLAPGIAQMLLDRRSDIEEVFAQHDTMVRRNSEGIAADNVTPLNVGIKRDF